MLGDFLVDDDALDLELAGIFSDIHEGMKVWKIWKIEFQESGVRRT